jgi:hypothetical protein
VLIETPCHSPSAPRNIRRRSLGRLLCHPCETSASKF